MLSPKESGLDLRSDTTALRAGLQGYEAGCAAESQFAQKNEAASPIRWNGIGAGAEPAAFDLKPVEWIFRIRTGLKEAREMFSPQG